MRIGRSDSRSAGTRSASTSKLQPEHCRRSSAHYATLQAAVTRSSDLRARNREATSVRYGLAVTIFLARHAHAGKRSEWVGDDQLRPLSPRGLLQAANLLDVIDDTPIGMILSSPYVRCVQTVEPLSASLGIPITPHDAFAEGASIDEAYALLLALDEVDGLACSHGDLIPPLLKQLVADGMDTDGPLIDQKGSIWVIETQRGKPFQGRYHPPTA